MKNQDGAEAGLTTDYPGCHLPPLERWESRDSLLLFRQQPPFSPVTVPKSCCNPFPAGARKICPKLREHLALQQIEFPQPQPEQSCLMDCISSCSP